ncbi:MAG: helix-turn-helix transcriptional regulator [Clostridia bacterium]
MSASEIASTPLKVGGKTNCKGRLRLFRKMRGMTQKDLRIAVGFSEKTAIIRIVQYEAGTRNPKPSMCALLARALNVSPAALAVPKTRRVEDVMHTLFAWEDESGFHFDKSGDVFCFRLVDKKDALCAALDHWHRQATLLERGEITKAQYDQWRYAYTESAGGETS